MLELMGSKIIKKAGTLFIYTLFLTITKQPFAADIINGEQLHNENCTRCHQPTIYQRDERIVKNLQHLRTQVQFCEVSNDLTWFDEEVDDVTEYLNMNYYFFEIK